MEDAGALWTTDQPAAPDRGSDGKSASKTAESKAKKDIGGDEDDAVDPVTPTPKPKAGAQKKAPAATGSSTKRGRKAREFDTDGEETTEKKSTPRKKSKVAPGTVIHE
jgi:hypothetical protein